MEWTESPAERKWRINEPDSDCLVADCFQPEPSLTDTDLGYDLLSRMTELAIAMQGGNEMDIA